MLNVLTRARKECECLVVTGNAKLTYQDRTLDVHNEGIYLIFGMVDQQILGMCPLSIMRSNKCL